MLALSKFWRFGIVLKNLFCGVATAFLSIALLPMATTPSRADQPLLKFIGSAPAAADGVFTAGRELSIRDGRWHLYVPHDQARHMRDAISGYCPYCEETDPLPECDDEQDERGRSSFHLRAGPDDIARSLRAFSDYVGSSPVIVIGSVSSPYLDGVDSYYKLDTERDLSRRFCPYCEDVGGLPDDCEDDDD